MGGWGGWWSKWLLSLSQLELRLSWAVTITQFVGACTVINTNPNSSSSWCLFPKHMAIRISRLTGNVCLFFDNEETIHTGFHRFAVINTKATILKLVLRWHILDLLTWTHALCGLLYVFESWLISSGRNCHNKNTILMLFLASWFILRQVLLERTGCFS